MTIHKRADSAGMWLVIFLSFFPPLPTKSAAQPASEVPSEVLLERQVFPGRLAQTRYRNLRLPFQKLKEPEGLKGKLRRGLFELGKNTNNGVCLLWVPDEGKLYVDQNGNLDLTDDADGIYSASKGTGAFSNVVMRFKMGEDVHPLQVDLQLWGGGSRNSEIQVVATLHSIWQDKLQFHGKSWQVGYMEGFLDWNSDGTDYLLIRPWEERTNLLSSYNPATGLLKLPKQLLWDGEVLQAQVNCTMQSGTSTPKLLWRAGEPVKMVQARVNGEYLERCVMSGTNGLTVLVTEPRKELRMPEGRYAIKGVSLKQGAAAAFRLPYEPQDIRVTAGTVLNLGGPLTNSVQFYRFGGLLRLQYWAVGADGGKYSLNNADRTKPPTFTIYHHGVKIASGKFEFG